MRTIAFRIDNKKFFVSGLDDTGWITYAENPYDAAVFEDDDKVASIVKAILEDYDPEVVSISSQEVMIWTPLTPADRDNPKREN